MNDSCLHEVNYLMVDSETMSFLFFLNKKINFFRERGWEEEGEKH